MEVSYFARNIYETETVTSGLCYIEDLICTIFVHQYTRFVRFDRWLRRYDHIHQQCITILLKEYTSFIGCYIIYQYIEILAVFIYSIM